MALPASPNAISLGQVNTELGISPSTTTISLNQAAVRALFVKSSGAIAMSDGHGKSNASPPSFFFLDSGDREAGWPIQAYVTNPNNTGLAYTATYTGTNNCGGGSARTVTGTYTGTLAAGVHAISGPDAINGVIASNKANTLGEAGYYSVSIYFPSFNLTLIGGGAAHAIYIRGADYVTQTGSNNGCLYSGTINGAPASCENQYWGNSPTQSSTTTENCCCYDCNGDGITACGNPADPEYDTSNPPCRAECNPGDPGSACGWSTNIEYNCDMNYVYTQCPIYGTTYDIIASPQC